RLLSPRAPAGQPAPGSARLFRRPHVSANRQAARQKVPQRVARPAAGPENLAESAMTASSQFLSSLFGLDDQVAVVIGGTGVLGGALCDGLAQAGTRVVVAGRSEERGHERVKAIEELGGEATFLPVTADQRLSVQALLDSTITAYGQVDMLVNCAGTNSAIPYEQIPDDQWHKVVDGSLLTTHLGCQIFAPFMATQTHGGSILNIGSVTSHLPLSRVFAYSAAKAAVVNLTKNLAREFAPKNVRVNVLCPSF